MDKRLRLLLIGTASLLIAQIGQFVAIRDINTIGHESGLALLFALVTIMVVPTTVIVTAVTLYTLRADWRQHERLFILGGINLLIAFGLALFFVDQCFWAQVFGLTLRGCHK